MTINENHKIRNKFVEHGKIYKSEGGITEFHTLSYSFGLNDPRKFIKAISFPKDSDFRIKLGEVSFAFLPRPNSTNEFIFAQLQCRREYEPNDYNVADSRGRWFIQSRFFVLDVVELKKLISHGLSIFDNLVINGSGDFRLDKYRHVIGEINNPPDVAFSFPNLDYFSIVLKPSISAAIKNIARALLRSDLVVVLSQKSSFSILEKLIIVQEVERLLLPVYPVPMSFALDYIVHPLNKINIRFQDEKDPRNQSAFVVNLLEAKEDDYVERAFNFFYSVKLGRREDEWKRSFSKNDLYQDKYVSVLSKSGLFIEASNWLKNIVLVGPDIFTYYKYLFMYKNAIDASLYNEYFLRRYGELRSDKQIFQSLLLDKTTSLNLLLSLVDSNLVEEEFSLEDWVELIVYSNIDLKRAEDLLSKHKGKLKFNEVVNILGWVKRNSSPSINYLKIVYKLFKERSKDGIDANIAFYILENLSSLIDIKHKEEIRFWVRFLELPDTEKPLWEWVESHFSFYQEAIYVSVIEEITKDQNINNIILSKVDRKKIRYLLESGREKNEVNAKLLSSLIENEISEIRSNQTIAYDGSTAPKLIPPKRPKILMDIIPFEEDNELEKVDRTQSNSKIKNSKNDIKNSLYWLFSLILILLLLRLILMEVSFNSSPESNLSPTTSPMPSVDINTSAPTIATTIQSGLWDGNGYLYYVNAEDVNNSTTTLYLLNSNFENKKISFENVKDVFMNVDDLFFYTAFDKDGLTSVHFVNASKVDVEITPSFLVFDAPGVYPGQDKKYDALFICNKFDLCLLSRQSNVGGVITRFDIDYLGNVYIVTPWNGPALYPNFEISSAAWLDVENIIFSLNSKESPKYFYNLNIVTREIIQLPKLQLSNDIVDIERWMGSTSTSVTFAILGIENDRNEVFILEEVEDVFPPVFDIRKILLPSQLSVDQLQWDPQKNYIALTGFLEGDSRCKNGCVFLLDVASESVKLVDNLINVQSIFWSTTINE